MAATWYVNASVRSPEALSHFLLAKQQEWEYTPACIWIYPGDSRCSSVARILSERSTVHVEELDNLREFEGIPDERLLEWLEYYNQSCQGILLLTDQAFQAVVRGYTLNWVTPQADTFGIAKYPDNSYCFSLAELIPSSVVADEPSAFSQRLQTPWEPAPNPSVHGYNSAPLSVSQPYQPAPESSSTVHAKLNVPSIIHEVKTKSQPTISQSVKLLDTQMQNCVVRAKAALTGKLETLSQKVMETLGNCTAACRQTLSSFAQIDSATLEHSRQLPTSVLDADRARIQQCHEKISVLQQMVLQKRTEYETARGLKREPQPLRILDTKTELGSAVLQLLVANFAQGTLKDVLVYVILHGSPRQSLQKLVDIQPGVTYVSVEDDQFFRDCTTADFSLWLMNENIPNYQASNEWACSFEGPGPVQPPAPSIPPNLYQH